MEGILFLKSVAASTVYTTSEQNTQAKHTHPNSYVSQFFSLKQKVKH